MRKVEPVLLREQDSEAMDDVSKSMKTSESAASRAIWIHMTGTFWAVPGMAALWSCLQRQQQDRRVSLCAGDRENHSRLSLHREPRGGPTHGIVSYSYTNGPPYAHAEVQNLSQA